MRIGPIVVVAFAAALAATTSAGAATITGLYNTGVSDSGNVLPDGTTPDLHYTLTGPGGPTDVIDTRVRTSAGGSPIPPYLGDDSVSAWIGPNNATLDGPGGLYDYKTTFNLTGDPSTASISGQWSSDNDGIEILLNGHDTNSLMNPYGPPFSYTLWDPFSISSFFVSGVNTLEFIVMNGNGGSDQDGPTALRVEFTPLPSTWTMLIAGFIALGFFAYRGTKRGSAAIAAA